MNISKKSKKNSNNSVFHDFCLKDYVTFIYLIIISAIVPLIVKSKNCTITIDELAKFNAEPQYMDMYSYYKSNIIVVSSVIMLIFYIADLFMSSGEPVSIKLKNFFKKNHVITICILLGFTFLSFIFSAYKPTVLQGSMQRFENIFVLFSYPIIFFSTIDFCKNKNRIKILLTIVGVSAFFIGFIGTFQAFGKDFFATKMASELVLGAEMALRGVRLTPIFTKTYATLYNPNYVGQYTVLLLPIFLSAGLVAKKIFFKALMLITFVLLFISLVGSSSAGGFFALIFSIAFYILVILIYTMKNKNILTKKTITFSFLSIVAIIIALMLPPVKSKIDEMYIKLTNSASVNPNFFINMRLEGKYAIIEFKDNYVKLSYDESGPSISFNEEEPLAIIQENTQDLGNNNIGTIKYFSVPMLGTVELRTFEEYLIFFGANMTLAFQQNDDNTLTVLNFRQEPYDLNTEFEHIGFEGKEFFATSRGYIWSRSFPLIKNSIFIGSGTDTFSLVFPQEDLLGKIRYMGSPYINVDKPHNLYLQIAINTGVISLLVFLYLILVYIFKTLKKSFGAYFIDKNILTLVFGVMIGLVGYLFTALTTDSNVSVSPVFWTIFGIGFALIDFFKKEKPEE